MMLLILAHTEGRIHKNWFTLFPSKIFLEGGEHLWTTIFQLPHSTYYTATWQLLNLRYSRVFQAYSGYLLVQAVPGMGEGSFPSHLVSGQVLGQDRCEDSSHWFLLFPRKKVVQTGQGCHSEQTLYLKHKQRESYNKKCCLLRASDS